jgi:DNA polymerase-4
MDGTKREQHFETQARKNDRPERIAALAQQLERQSPVVRGALDAATELQAKRIRRCSEIPGRSCGKSTPCRVEPSVQIVEWQRSGPWTRWWWAMSERRQGGPAGILHADLDAFYAAVEQLLDPSLRGKPIAVGGGVVLAASYEAKACGVRGGMPARRARELCPQLRLVPGHFTEYERLGDAAIKILGDFTPLVERLSIDEAFADVAGCERLFGPPAEIARAIRRRVREELGLAISIGVARTKHLAKIASQAAKPDGLVVVDPENELEFLHDLPVELMWGVGPVTKERLAGMGVRTIGQLARVPGQHLECLLGHALGEKLTALAWNRDPREIRTHHRAQSAGAQSALGRKPAEEWVYRPTLWHLADRIGTRLRAKSLAARTVTVRVRFVDLRSVTRSVTLRAPISATAILAEIAEELVRGVLIHHPEERSISLLAIAASKLERPVAVQLELSLAREDEKRRPGSKRGMARWAADGAIDKIRDRFGWEAVGYGTLALGVSSSVPDAFRQLAQKEL